MMNYVFLGNHRCIVQFQYYNVHLCWFIYIILMLVEILSSTLFLSLEECIRMVKSADFIITLNSLVISPLCDAGSSPCLRNLN